MRTIHLIILVIALLIIVPSSALVAADSAQYKTSIEVHNGIAMIDMGDHVEFLDTVNENSQTMPAYKISGYNGTVTITPDVLPNTSSAHGAYTCTSHNHGIDFTITNDTPCNER